MATKKTTFGRSTDLDDLNLDSLEFPDETPSSGSSKSRNPITRIASGFASGAKEQFTNKSYIKSVIKKALPDGYDTAFDAADKVSDGARELYHSAARELRPSLPAMKRITGAFAKRTEGKLPKSVQKKLESFGKSDERGSSYNPDSEELKGALADVFQTQMQETQRLDSQREARTLLREQIQYRQHGKSLAQLKAIRQGIEKRVAYQDQVLVKYQKRSLELQYRQFFTLRDMLKLQSADSQFNRKAFEALVKNTALPEYQKIKMSERYKDLLRNRLITRSQTAATNYISNFGEQLRKNLMTQLASAASGFNFAVSGLDDLSQNAAMAREMGMEMDPLEMGGGAVGGMAAQALGNKAAKWAKGKLSKNPRMRQGGARVANFIDQFPMFANRWAKSGTTDMGWKGLLAQFAKDFVPTMHRDDRLRGSPILKGDQAAIFDNATRRSITEVIPGYLSRILREVTVLRTGDDSTGRIIYNQDQGKFTSLKSATQDAHKRILGGMNVRFQQGALNDFINHLDPEGKLSSDQRQQLAKQLLSDIDSIPGFDFARYTKPNADLKEMDTDTQATLASLLKGRFEGTEDMRRALKGDTSNQVEMRKTLDQFKSLRSAINDPKSIIKAYMDAGLEEAIDPLGLLKTDGFTKSIDRERYYDLLLNATDDQGEGFNDAFIKTRSEAERKADLQKERFANARASTKGVFSGVRDRFNRVKESAKEAYEGSRVQSVAERLRGSASRAGGKARDWIQHAADLYLPDSTIPKLKGSVLRAGGYLSAKTGKVIRKLEDIADGVIGLNGEPILTAEEASRGLHTEDGEPVIQPTRASYTPPTRAPGSTVRPQGPVPGETVSRPRVAPAPQATSTWVEPEPTSAVDRLLEGFKDRNEEQLNAITELLERGIYTRDLGELPEGAEEGKGWFRPGMTRRGIRQVGRGLRSGARLFGKYAGGVYRGAFSVAKLPFKVLGAMRNQVPDIYVKGDKVPSLFAKKLKKGAYVDVKTNKVIKGVKGITGPVRDLSDNGNIVISQEEYDRGLVDRVGHPLTRGILSGARKLLGAFADYGSSAFSFPFHALAAGFRGASKVVGGLFRKDKPEDIYVRDDPEHPRLRAVLMRKGMYYCEIGGKLKKVKRPSQIKGPVYSTEHGKPEEVISLEEYKKGLYDVNGKKISHSGGLVSGLAEGLGAAVGGFASYAGKTIGGMFKIAGSIFGGIGRGAAGVIRRLTGGTKYDLKQATAAASFQTVDLLERILTLLDERIPKPERIRKGSWKDQALHEAEDETPGTGSERSTKGGSGLLGWLASKFSGQGDDDDDDGGNNYFIDSQGRKRPKLKGRGTFGRKAKAFAKKGWRKLARSRGGRMVGRAGRFLGRTRAGRFLGRGLGAARSVGGRLLASRGGAMAARTLAGGERMVGGLGRAAFGAGRLALGLGGAEALASVGGGLMTAATTVGSGIATAATAIGSGLATAAGAVGSVLTAPVVLGAAAVAALGAGIYFGVKYYNLKKDRPLRKYRMAQYGVDITQSVWPMGKVQSLEDYMKDKVTISEGTASFKKSAFKDMEKIYKIFDLEHSWYNPVGWFSDDDSDENRKKKQALIDWLSYRFKPVYLTWRAAVDAIDKTKALDELDDLKASQKLKLLEVVASKTDASIYKLAASPFGDDKISTDPDVVKAALDEAKTKFEKAAKKEEKDDKSKQKGKVGLTTAAAIATKKANEAAFGLEGSKPGTADTTKTGKKPGSDKRQQADARNRRIQQMAATSVASAGVMGVSAVTLKSTPFPKGSSVGRRLSALTAIRFKAYGLTTLKIGDVRAVATLEEDVLKHLRYASDNSARFHGKVDDYFAQFAGSFGLSTDNQQEKTRWFYWFRARFLPVVLQFASKIKHINANVDPLDVEAKFDAVQLLDVAKAVIATRSRPPNTDTFISVWEVTMKQSPISGDPLNTDSSSVDDNLNVLKNAVKNKTASQAQAKLDTSTKKTGTPTPKKTGGKSATATSASVTASKADQSKPGSGFGDTPAPASRSPYTASMYTSWGSTPKGSANDAAYQGTPIQQPGHGTGGDINEIPKATGVGWDNVKDTIIAAAKMVGVSPDLMATFANMESGFNPYIKAPTSSATGLYQFIKKTWRGMLKKYGDKYGISPNTSPKDARANALMGAEFLKQNERTLERFLGRTPTMGEMYLAHFLGATGAKSLLKAPRDALASQVNPDAAGSNPSIFYTPDQRPRTVGQMIALLDTRLKKRSVDIPASAMKAVRLADTTGNKTPIAGGSTTTTANGPTGGQTKAPKPLSGFEIPTSAGFAKTPPRADFSSLRAPALDRAPQVKPSLAKATPHADHTQAVERKVASTRQHEAVQAATLDSVARSHNEHISKNVSSMAGILSDQLQAQRDLVGLFTKAVGLLNGINDNSVALVKAGNGEQTEASRVAQGPKKDTSRLHQAAEVAPEAISIQRSDLRKVSRTA